uniref:Uncharacterized protein n=1 Tax=Trichogramma kaykai TaxID=54128 RepID=A0ABD2XIP3_9HYME
MLYYSGRFNIPRQDAGAQKLHRSLAIIARSSSVTIFGRRSASVGMRGGPGAGPARRAAHLHQHLPLHHEEREQLRDDGQGRAGPELRLRHTADKERSLLQRLQAAAGRLQEEVQRLHQRQHRRRHLLRPQDLRGAGLQVLAKIPHALQGQASDTAQELPLQNGLRHGRARSSAGACWKLH